MPSSNTLPISAIVLTYNEEQNLEACLASLADWVGEILVVDSGSTDGTLAIAASYTDRLHRHPFENYSRQRNWAQENLPLHYDWVLHIDADERVSRELRQAIEAFFRDGVAERVNGAIFSRRTVFMGRWIRYGGHYPVYHARLFRVRRGRCEDRLYDQHFTVEPPSVLLPGDLIDILTVELDTWAQRHLRWAAQEARELCRDPRNLGNQVASRPNGSPIEQRRWLRNRVFGRAPLFSRAFAYFTYRYLFRLGFLDGVEGLVFHFLHGCWYRFYVDAKIWEASRKGEAARLQ